MAELSYVDTAALLRRIPAEIEIVLVGGQAINFWAGYFHDRIPELASLPPFTSKDIDFLGNHHAVKNVQRRLMGVTSFQTNLRIRRRARA